MPGLAGSRREVRLIADWRVQDVSSVTRAVPLSTGDRHFGLPVMSSGVFHPRRFSS